MQPNAKLSDILEAQFSIALTRPPAVLSVSESVAELLGFHADEFLSNKINLQSLIHPDDQDIAEILFSTNKEYRSDIVNIRLRHADGRIRCIKAYFNKVSDPTRNSAVIELCLQDAKSLWQQQDQTMMADFNAMMDNADDYMYFKDRNHIFTSASQTIVNVTDKPQHWTELLGQSDYDIFCEDDADSFYRLEKQVFSGAHFAQEIQQVRDNNDQTVWIDNRKYAIHNQSGDIIGLFGFARDITEDLSRQQKIDNLLAEQSAIINNNLIGIATACNRKINWANRTFETMLGYDEGELIDCPTRILYAFEKDYQTIGQAYINIVSEGVVQNELEFKRKDGSTIWMNIRGSECYKKTNESIWVFVDVTERKHAEEALKNSEYYWKFAIEGSGDGLWDWDISNNRKIFSKQWKAILGYGEFDDLPTGSAWENRFHPDDKAHVEHTMHAYLSGMTKKYKLECRMKCKNGDYRWILSRGMVVKYSKDGTPLRMVGTISDISERKQAEHNLYIAATAFESQEGMMVTDANNIILRVNKAFTTITGYAAEEAVGNRSSLLSSGRHDASFYQTMWEEIRETNYWEGEIWNKRKNGEIYPQHLTITAVKDANQNVTNYVGTLIDITESKQAEQEIEDLAYYDPLTHLPNRRLMIDRINHAMAASARHNKNGALLFLDLDHFKTLNDTLGHDMGDRLLQQVATRLTACIRENDTVSRFGGDEFVILLEELSTHTIEAATQVEDIANKILASLSDAYMLENHHYSSSTSIGITLINDHLSKVDDLLKQADIAMYQAKKDGRNTIRFFDPEMQTRITAHAKLENELKQAIALKQFQLYYQVQMDSAQRAIGAEALIRWHHPEQGLISPINFIPLAEQNGSILAIGRWVLDVACAQLKVWQSDPIMCELTLSINISAKQFHQPDFLSQIIRLIDRHTINPKRLKLELTESLLLDNIEQTITKMKVLADIGIQFSLDDFGTGYSSLQYLKRLPLHQLKIDKSFVDNIVDDGDDQIIVRTIIAMAHSLGLTVIAEGVETQEQRQQLFNEGCTQYQGYLYSKPLAIDSFDTLLTHTH